MPFDTSRCGLICCCASTCTCACVRALVPPRCQPHQPRLVEQPGVCACATAHATHVHMWECVHTHLDSVLNRQVQSRCGPIRDGDQHFLGARPSRTQADRQAHAHACRASHATRRLYDRTKPTTPRTTQRARAKKVQRSAMTNILQCVGQLTSCKN